MDKLVVSLTIWLLLLLFYSLAFPLNIDDRVYMVSKRENNTRTHLPSLALASLTLAP